MSSPIRGRALVINNMNFIDENKKVHCREGSEVDISNVLSMLKELSFERIVAKDFTAEVS